MDFSINYIIDMMSKMVKGKFVMYNTIETNVSFASMKHKKLQLIYCSSPKKNETVITCQITDRMATDGDIKRVDTELARQFSNCLIQYIMSDEFKNLTNGSNI